jgi:hypothetical protein
MHSPTRPIWPVLICLLYLATNRPIVQMMDSQKDLMFYYIFSGERMRQPFGMHRQNHRLHHSVERQNVKMSCSRTRILKESVFSYIYFVFSPLAANGSEAKNLMLLCRLHVTNESAGLN